MKFQALLVLAFAAYAQAGQWVYVEDPAGEAQVTKIFRLAQLEDLLQSSAGQGGQLHVLILLLSLGREKR